MCEYDVWDNPSSKGIPYSKTVILPDPVHNHDVKPNRIAAEPRYQLWRKTVAPYARPGWVNGEGKVF
jgi:hypothetical protein